MRYTRFSIVAASMLFASVATVKAQTADEIVQKHITAIGGMDNWAKVNSIKMSGSVDAGGNKVPITVTTLNGKGQKVEFIMDGKPGYEILTPTAGWSYSPAQGQTKPEAIPTDVVKESQDELDVQGPLINYKAKGTKIVYQGKEKLDGTDCYKLLLSHKNGKTETMYLDAATYYHIRSVEKIKVNGKAEESVSKFGDYQKLPEGVVCPMTIENDGGPITFKSIIINKPVDENIFKPTFAAAKPAAPAKGVKK